MDWNHSCCFGLSGNTFGIMRNITIVTGITFRGGGYKCGFYTKFILVDIEIGNKLFSGVVSGSTFLKEG